MGAAAWRQLGKADKIGHGRSDIVNVARWLNAALIAVPFFHGRGSQH
jgi:hypothetical protein